MINENIPLISIVTPSYNQGNYLEKTIQSVLSQTYPRIEYIIIDGGSTDNSLSIIKKYEKYLSYWVSESDMGQSHAIAKGLSKAKGDIFAWQNSDDLYERETFAYVVNAFQHNPEIDLLFGGWHFIDENDNVLATRWLRGYTLLKLQAGLCIPPQPCVFFRREAIIRVGGIDITKRHVMDYSLYLKIANKRNVFITKKVLGSFRIHKYSKTIAERREQEIELRQTRRELLESNASISEKMIWLFRDVYVDLRDKLHKTLNIFSFRELLRGNEYP